MGLNNTPEWTNNFNDGQEASVVQAALSGNHSYNATTLYLSAADQYDSDALGYENYRVGDTLFITGSATTAYEIEAISRQNTTQMIATITSGLVDGVDAGVVVYKDQGGSFSSNATLSAGYKGNQSSVENHLRLRRQGQI